MPRSNKHSHEPQVADFESADDGLPADLAPESPILGVLAGRHDPARSAEAKRVVDTYRILEPRSEDAEGFSVRCLELPGVLGAGATAEEARLSCVRNAVAVVLTMLNAGIAPPKPGAAPKPRGRTITKSARLPADLALWCEQSAEADGKTFTEWLCAQLETIRDRQD